MSANTRLLRTARHLACDAVRNAHHRACNLFPVDPLQFRQGAHVGHQDVDLLLYKLFRILRRRVRDRDDAHRLLNPDEGFIAGDLRIALLSTSTISGGVPVGTETTLNVTTARPGTPASCAVGTSGSMGSRLSSNTASTRSRPCLWSSTTALATLGYTWMRPAWISGMAGAAPR